MKYSAWGRDGVADTFVSGDQLPAAIAMIDPGLRLICVFEAATYEDALEVFADIQGGAVPARKADRRLAGCGT